VKNWLNLFVDYHNRELRTVNWTGPYQVYSENFIVICFKGCTLYDRSFQVLSKLLQYLVNCKESRYDFINCDYYLSRNRLFVVMQII
jgi:hypothetical protein